MTTSTPARAPAAFAIGVRYLTGYCVAASPADGSPEWPPHPARLFMALVAAHYEMAEDAPAGQAALNWLEQLPPPRVLASDIDRRTTVEVYVPPNDYKSSDIRILPQFRTNRQPRTFPRVRPHVDEVLFL